jgi:hypothetical protein
MRIALSTKHFGFPHFVHAMELFYIEAEVVGHKRMSVIGLDMRSGSVHTVYM